MAIGDIWRVAVEGTYDGQEVVCTGHFQAKSVGATGAGAATALAGILNGFTTYLCTNLLWSNKHWQLLAVPPTVGDTSFTQAGTSTAAGLPGTVAIVVSLRTGSAGRSYRGRIYVPGVDESVTDKGQLVNPYLSGAQTNLDSNLAVYGDGGSSPDYLWGIYSHKLGDIRSGGVLIGYDADAFFPIKSGIVRAVLGSQRRRRIGVGS